MSTEDDDPLAYRDWPEYQPGPPIPFSEIRPHYRNRDLLRAVPAFWDFVKLWFSLCRADWWGENRVGPFVAANVAWGLAFPLEGVRFRPALRRACKARGYACIGNSVYQLPPRRRKP